jgi:hypothetical protein
MAPSSDPANGGLASMCQLEKSLLDLPETDTTLSDGALVSLGIRKAPQLDIDNPGALDGSPVFFQPLDDGPGFRQTVEDTEDEIDGYSICPYKDDHVDRLACATITLSWFDSLADAVYPKDHPKWLGTRQVVPYSDGVWQKADLHFHPAMARGTSSQATLARKWQTEKAAIAPTNRRLSG